MGLTAEALTSVPDAKAWLRDDTASAGLVELLINAYSRAIRLYCARQFHPEPAGDPLPAPTVKRFRYDGGGYLTLAPTELRPLDLGAITLYADQDVEQQDVLTTPDDYTLEPRGATIDGTYLWLALPEVENLDHYGVEVTIEARWGMAAVPSDVVIACLIAVANGYRNPESFASRSLGELSFSEELTAEPVEAVGRALPPDARALLSPYRRQAIGS